MRPFFRAALTFALLQGLLLPGAFAQDKERVDLQFKVIEASTTKKKADPELKKLFAKLPVSYSGLEQIDGHTKGKLAAGERASFQIKGNKQWVHVVVLSISNDGIQLEVRIGEKGKGLKATATKRGATVLVGPLFKSSKTSDILIAVTPK